MLNDSPVFRAENIELVSYLITGRHYGYVGRDVEN